MFTARILRALVRMKYFWHSIFFCPVFQGHYIERFGNGWILLDMRFGENRNFQEGKNHRYYKSTFQELLNLTLEK